MENNTSTNFDLEAALNAGITPEQMMDDFAKQLALAKRNYDEKKKQEEEKNKSKEEERINKTRLDVVDAVTDYAAALGLIEEESIDEDMKKEIAESLKEIESEYTKMIPFLRIAKDVIGDGFEVRGVKIKKDNDDESDRVDKVISRFLKSIE